MFGQVTLWRKVAALAPALLLAVLLPAEGLLRCRMDGLVRTSCCCPAEDAAARPAAAITTPVCCQRVVSGEARLPAEAVAPAASDAVARLALAPAPPVPLDLGVTEGERRAPRSYRPPGGGQSASVVLLEHVLLI